MAIQSMHTKVVKRILHVRPLFLLLLVDFLIWFNVQPLRQVFVFLFFSFFPGLMILSFFDLKIKFWETIIYSMCVSISFLTGVGLLANSIYPLFGFSAPLSFHSLLLTFNVTMIVLCLLSFLKKTDQKLTIPTLESFSGIGIPCLPILGATVLPLLSLVGTRLVNHTGVNSVLFPAQILAVTIIAFMGLRKIKKDLQDFVYPYIIYMISVSVLLAWTLRSEYILGFDVHLEKFMFDLTRTNNYWSFDAFKDPYIDTLSVTIFPTVLQNLTGIGSTLLFKLVYPFYYSFVPVGLYFLFSKFTNKPSAFLSAVFVIGVSNYNMSGLAKEAIAVIFFVMAVLLLTGGLKSLGGKVLLFSFSFGLITAHYAIAFYFSAFVVLYLLLAKLGSILEKRGSKEYSEPYYYFAFVAVFVFFWYGKLTILPFSSVVNTLSSLFREYSLSSSIKDVGQLAMESGLGGMIVQIIGKGAKYFIVIGMIYRCAGAAINRFKFSSEVERKSFYLSLSSFLLLVTYVLGGSLQTAYNPERLYYKSLLLLAPTAIIGTTMLFKVLKYIGKRIIYGFRETPLKKYADIWATIFVILYFLVGTQFIYQSLGPREDPFLYHNTGISYERYYVHSSEVACLKWLSDQRPEMVYADRYGVLRLWSYGGVPNAERYESINKEPYAGTTRSYTLSNRTGAIERYAYIFLRYQNRVLKTYSVGQDVVYKGPLEEISGLFETQNRVYDNGEASIYQSKMANKDD